MDFGIKNIKKLLKIFQHLRLGNSYTPDIPGPKGDKVQGYSSASSAAATVAIQGSQVKLGHTIQGQWMKKLSKKIDILQQGQYIT